MNQKPLFLNKDQACFLLIDLQQRFIPAMEQSEYELIRKNIIILSQAAKILNIPLLYTQQYTKGLGNTDPLILSHIDGEYTLFQILKKSGSPEFKEISSLIK